MKIWSGTCLCALAILVAQLTVCESMIAPDDSHGEATDMGTVIGIDLGTTYSCVGVYRNGKTEIIANDMGNRITPSYVAFTDEERLIGDSAKNQAASNPSRTIYDAKRLMGRNFGDSSVQRDMKLFPFELVKGANGKPQVQVDVRGESERFAPEEISAMILKKMKETAEVYLGEKVTHAVVTVPAYFNDAQRQATKDAGVIAGLTIARIINEPTAAAIAYGVKERARSEGEKNIIVYDLGGGTFDVTLLTTDGEMFEVLATGGDTHLGGEDFDNLRRLSTPVNAVVKHFVDKFKKTHGVDIMKNKRALARLRRECEKAKRVLSTQHQARIEIESLADGIDLDETLSRARFEELNMKLFKKTLKSLSSVLGEAEMKKHDVDEVVLVGGSTRIPKVREMVKAFFNGKEPNLGLNPDEAVAHGAAIQAAILGGHSDEPIVVLDVTPLSLGIETVGGVMTKLIGKNSVIPTEKSQIFSTHQDNQEAVMIQVFQGERAMTADNIQLGKFSLGGIPPARRGVPQLEVTFRVDADGILSVKAVDKNTGQREELTIDREARDIDEDELREMLRKAEEMEDYDREVKERVDSRNALESLVYSVTQQLDDDENEQFQRLSEDDRNDIEDATAEVLEWLEENQAADKEDYDDHRAELESLVREVLSSGGGAYYNADPDMPGHDDL